MRQSVNEYLYYNNPDMLNEGLITWIKKQIVNLVAGGKLAEAEREINTLNTQIDETIESMEAMTKDSDSDDETVKNIKEFIAKLHEAQTQLTESLSPQKLSVGAQIATSILYNFEVIFNPILLMTTLGYGVKLYDAIVIKELYLHISRIKLALIRIQLYMSSPDAKFWEKISMLTIKADLNNMSAMKKTIDSIAKLKTGSASKHRVASADDYIQSLCSDIQRISERTFDEEIEQCERMIQSFDTGEDPDAKLYIEQLLCIIKINAKNKCLKINNSISKILHLMNVADTKGEYMNSVVDSLGANYDELTNSKEKDEETLKSNEPKLKNSKENNEKDIEEGRKEFFQHTQDSIQDFNKLPGTTQKHIKAWVRYVRGLHDKAESKRSAQEKEDFDKWMKVAQKNSKEFPMKFYWLEEKTLGTFIYLVENLELIKNDSNKIKNVSVYNAKGAHYDDDIHRGWDKFIVPMRNINFLWAALKIINDNAPEGTDVDKKVKDMIRKVSKIAEFFESLTLSTLDSNNNYTIKGDDDKVKEDREKFNDILNELKSLVKSLRGNSYTKGLVMSVTGGR